jgi:hypothetical protein
MWLKEKDFQATLGDGQKSTKEIEQMVGLMNIGLTLNGRQNKKVCCPEWAQ